jgi:GxxExxY protein
MDKNNVTGKIIGYAIEVHKILGPGLLESAYEECLTFELKRNGLLFRRQLATPVIYKDIRLDCGYRIDLLVEDLVIVELKSVDQICPVHIAQIITYLRFSKKSIGLLINFNVKSLRDGIRRFVL